jgi:fibronectin type 3 domain-containing protein
VRVQWSAITTAGVTYNVYRGTTSGGEQLYAPGLRGTRLDDSAVTRGQTYYYRVTAVNAAGESAPSREVSARVR